MPAAPAQLARPTRVALFTDTFGDVNGVSRFIQDIAAQASLQHRDLHVLTSTRKACPDRPNIHNTRPRLRFPMPGYPFLDAVWPNARALRLAADRIQPHAVHVSTPGPVGWLGRRYAMARSLPLVATHHTDFPAYIDHLFSEPVLTWLSARALARFYRPFSRVLVRSDESVPMLESLGVPPDRVELLPPGIDTALFNPRSRDARDALWAHLPGVRPSSTKVLYVGRVSVEKNLPLLTSVWAAIRAAGIARGLDAQLIVVGDGPYRRTMQGQLAGPDAIFLGFRHGTELAAIYASSDLFLFPSTTDTLGQAVMEAQACGLPAIVADRGGPARIVDHGATGFVLSLEPASECRSRWTEAILRLIADRPLRERLGSAGAAGIAPLSIARSFEHFWRIHETVARNAIGPARSMQK